MFRTITISLVCLWMGSFGSPLRAQFAARNAETEKLKAQVQALNAELEVLKQQNNLIKRELDETQLAKKSLEDRLAKVQKASAESRVTVYSLQYLAAEDAGKIINELAGADDLRLAIDERTNALIVAAPTATQQTIGEILERLDTQSIAEEPNKSVEYNVSTDQIEVIGSSIGNRFPKARVRSVERSAGTSSLVVEAPSKVHTDIGQLIKELAKRDKTQMLRVVWLMTEAGAVVDVPEDVKPVVAELEKLGVQNMSVAAQAIIRTAIGSRFESSSLALPPALGDTCQLSVAGSLLDSNRIQISLQATQLGQKSALASIDTSLTIPVGHPVVLGVNPVGERTSAFLIMVRD